MPVKTEDEQKGIVRILFLHPLTVIVLPITTIAFPNLGTERSIP